MYERDRERQRERQKERERERDNWLETELKGHCRVCLQIRYLQIERFSQCSLNFGERPTEVLHFNIKTDPIKVSPSQINAIRKQDKKRIIWTQNGQKQGDRIFWGAWCLNKKCREWSNPYKYGILAKTNEAISRKWQKNAKNT